MAILFHLTIELPRSNLQNFQWLFWKTVGTIGMIGPNAQRNVEVGHQRDRVRAREKQEKMIVCKLKLSHATKWLANLPKVIDYQFVILYSKYPKISEKNKARSGSKAYTLNIQYVLINIKFEKARLNVATVLIKKR